MRAVLRYPRHVGGTADCKAQLQPSIIAVNILAGCFDHIIIGNPRIGMARWSLDPSRQKSPERRIAP